MSCPLLPCTSSFSIQSNSMPCILLTLSKALSILLILSFNLISDVENATTSFEASILPVVAEGVIAPTAKEVVILALPLTSSF